MSSVVITESEKILYKLNWFSICLEAEINCKQRHYDGSLPLSLVAVHAAAVSVLVGVEYAAAYTAESAVAAGWNR